LKVDKGRSFGGGAKMRCLMWDEGLLELAIMIEPKKEQSNSFLYNRELILRQRCQKNAKREKILELQLHVNRSGRKRVGK